MTSRGSSSGQEPSANPRVVPVHRVCRSGSQLAVVLAQVELVVGVEGLDALDERVLLGAG